MLLLPKQGRGSMKLKMVGTEGGEGEVLLRMEDAQGSPYELHFTIPEVALLMGMLRTSTDEAMKRPPSSEPDLMLPMQTFKIGEDPMHKIFRIEISEGIYQDYCAPLEHPISTALQKLVEILEIEVADFRPEPPVSH
jgi:hypothetical protein